MKDTCSRYIHGNLVLVWMTRSVFFQRIGQPTRQGGPAYIDLERFIEALHDSTTNLMYPALTGAQKQSVDVERLFRIWSALWRERGILQKNNTCP